MTASEAIALYRAEKEAALLRGVNIARPAAIPERFDNRAIIVDADGVRHDAFRVHPPRA